MGLFLWAGKLWHGTKSWLHDQLMWLLIGQSIIYNMVSALLSARKSNNPCALATGQCTIWALQSC